MSENRTREEVEALWAKLNLMTPHEAYILGMTETTEKFMAEFGPKKEEVKSE